MRVQGKCKAAAVGPERTSLKVLVPLILSAILVSCAEAFIDIRAPEKDAAVLEAQPQTQVHLVFSSHLVSRKAQCIPLQDSTITFECHRKTPD